MHLLGRMVATWMPSFPSTDSNLTKESYALDSTRPAAFLLAAQANSSPVLKNRNCRRMYTPYTFYARRQRSPFYRRVDVLFKKTRSIFRGFRENQPHGPARRGTPGQYCGQCPTKLFHYETCVWKNDNFAPFGPGKNSVAQGETWGCVLQECSQSRRCAGNHFSTMCRISWLMNGLAM